MAISPAFSNLVAKLGAASRTDSPVLLSGDTGTGKRQAAISIHRSSPRRNARFVTINCIGISDNRFELELCGSQTTDFEMNRKGALFLAERGSLYLHEVTELSKQAQSLLLRCIESGVYTPVGGNDPVLTDVRIIASSSANIQAAVEAGKFRTDLYHFLTAMVVHTPSLNDRLDDLPRLANMMLSELAPGSNLSLSAEAVSMLVSHSFSGNLVELKNILHRAVTQLGADSSAAAVIDPLCMQRALVTSNTVSARDASASEQRLVVDYMPAEVPEVEQQTISYGLQHEGRWTATDTSVSSLSNAELRNLDEPTPISEFSNDDVAHQEEKDSRVGSIEKPIEASRPISTSSFMSLKEQERQYFVDLMAKCDGDKHAAAKIAGVTLRTLYRKLEEV